MENDQVAAPQGQGTEATNTNTTTVKETNTVSDTQTQVSQPTANIPADQIEAFNKFIDANGGYEKAFAKLKSDVSNPQPKAESQPQPQPEPKVVEPMQTSQENSGMTMKEFMTQQYFNSLANVKDYENIADKIRSGEVISEMARLGISVYDGDNFNDQKINDFLKIYAKTVPAKPASTPTATATPTVDYVNVGENITSYEEAMKVASQSGHPRYNDAINYLKGHFAKKK